MIDENIIRKNGMNLQKIINYLICLFLFLLPWQTRWIYLWGELNGGYFEYGTLSFYGIEILLWFIVILFAVLKIMSFLRRQESYKKFWQSFALRIKKLSKKSIWFLMLYVLSLVLFGVVLFTSLNFDISLQWVTRFIGVLCLGVVLVITACHPRAGGDPVCKDNLIGNRFLISLWFGAVLQGLIAFIQFFMQWIPANKWLGWAYHSGIDGGASVIEFADGRFLRAYGSFGSPNSLGIYLSVCLVVGLIICLKIQNSKFKILLTVGQLLILSGLILSFSRNAWISCLIGLIVLFFIVYFNKKPKIVSFLRSLSTGEVGQDLHKLSFLRRQESKCNLLFKQLFYYLILFISLFIILNPLFTSRFNLNNRLESRSVIERGNQYFESINLLKENILFGTGPGNYTLALSEKYPNRQIWEYQPVHNIYLLSLVELGIFGFLVYWGLALFLIKQVFKNNKVFLAPILVMLVAGLFDHWLFSMYTGMVLFWLIFSLSFCNKQEPV